MRTESRVLLEDVRQAAGNISAFTAGKNQNDYHDNIMLQSAVERQFEIIGEALNQLSKKDPELVESIINYKMIISFRNILIHGYSVVDNKVVWNIVVDHLPKLHEQIINLLKA